MPRPIPTPTDRGHDVDDMNGKRQLWGVKLVAYLHDLTGVDPDDAIPDAIAYLLHAAPLYGMTPEAALRSGSEGFTADTDPKGGW